MRGLSVKNSKNNGRMSVELWRKIMIPGRKGGAGDNKSTDAMAALAEAMRPLKIDELLQKANTYLTGKAPLENLGVDETFVPEVVKRMYKNYFSTTNNTDDLNLAGQYFDVYSAIIERLLLVKGALELRQADKTTTESEDIIRKYEEDNSPYGSIKGDINAVLMKLSANISRLNKFIVLEYVAAILDKRDLAVSSNASNVTSVPAETQATNLESLLTTEMQRIFSAKFEPTKRAWIPSPFAKKSNEGELQIDDVNLLNFSQRITDNFKNASYNLLNHQQGSNTVQANALFFREQSYYTDKLSSAEKITLASCFQKIYDIMNAEYKRLDSGSYNKTAQASIKKQLNTLYEEAIDKVTNYIIESRVASYKRPEDLDQKKSSELSHIAPAKRVACRLGGEGSSNCVTLKSQFNI